MPLHPLVADAGDQQRGRAPDHQEAEERHQEGVAPLGIEAVGRQDRRDERGQEDVLLARRDARPVEQAVGRFLQLLGDGPLDQQALVLEQRAPFLDSRT